MKIFVAIPVYDGKLQVQTVKCLLEETTVANGLGDDLRVNFLPSCSVPAQGRNQLVQMFMESDCDRLFFLDADLTFSPGSIIKLCHMPHEFVGGCYRYKQKDEQYPITWLPPEREKEQDGQRGLWSDQYGMIEVAMLPTGFLALSRSVFDTFRAKYPGREYAHWGSKAYAYFQMVFKDGGLWSDDTYFCKEWVDAGGKIYLDPYTQLAHWDFNPTPFAGDIGAWLKKQNSNSIQSQGASLNG